MTRKSHFHVKYCVYKFIRLLAYGYNRNAECLTDLFERNIVEEDVLVRFQHSFRYKDAASEVAGRGELVDEVVSRCESRYRNCLTEKSVFYCVYLYSAAREFCAEPFRKLFYERCGKYAGALLMRESKAECEQDRSISRDMPPDRRNVDL